MSIEGLIISMSIVAALLLWSVMPFFVKSHEAEAISTSVERQRERLNVYYERVLRNLHDLDEDYATGKLDQDDYALEREKWAQRGIQALKALDELDAQHLVTDSSADDATIDEAIDRRIEQAIDDHQAEPDPKITA